MFSNQLSSYAVVLSGRHTPFNRLNKTTEGVILDLYLKIVFNKIMLIKSLVFWNKMKNEMKWNSEYLFELAYLEINAKWKTQYFFWYCINTTVCKFSNFNTGTVNAIQKKLVKQIGERIKSLLLSTLLELALSYLPQFLIACNQLSISTWEKRYEHIYHSPPYISVITGNILKICPLRSFCLLPTALS